MIAAGVSRRDSSSPELVHLGGWVMHNSTVYTIHSRDDGVKILKEKIELKGFPEIGGLKNTGVINGILHENQGAGIRFIKTVIEPNGYLAPHASPNTSCLFILKGSGEMANVDGQDKVINKIFFKASDMLIFTVPMPRHYYQAGPDGAEYLAVSFPQETG